jgi:hypothetical protein
MLAKNILTKKFSKKLNEDNVLAGKLKEKNI